MILQCGGVRGPLEAPFVYFVRARELLYVGETQAHRCSAGVDTCISQGHSDRLSRSTETRRSIISRKWLFMRLNVVRSRHSFRQVNTEWPHKRSSTCFTSFLPHAQISLGTSFGSFPTRKKPRLADLPIGMLPATLQSKSLRTLGVTSRRLGARGKRRRATT